MTNPTEKLRRDAKALKKAFDRSDIDAVTRVRAYLLGASGIKHADALHAAPANLTFSGKLILLKNSSLIEARRSRHELLI